MIRVRTALVLLGFAVAASTARAEAYIELTALTPENGPGGYLPETTVEFQVGLSADNTQVELVRWVMLDFAESSPELRFIDPFHWDYSTLMGGFFYSQFLHYPQPGTTYTGTTPFDGFVLEIPVGGTLVLGTGLVSLPGDAGVYELDAVGRHSFPGYGAQIALFSDPIICDPGPCPPHWLVGDPLALTVVPEPGGLLLLGLGAVAMSRRRGWTCR